MRSFNVMDREAMINNSYHFYFMLPESAECGFLEGVLHKGSFIIVDSENNVCWKVFILLAICDHINKNAEKKSVKRVSFFRFP